MLKSPLVSFLRIVTSQMDIASTVSLVVEYTKRLAILTERSPRSLNKKRTLDHISQEENPRDILRLKKGIKSALNVPLRSLLRSFIKILAISVDMSQLAKGALMNISAVRQTRFPSRVRYVVFAKLRSPLMSFTKTISLEMGIILNARTARILSMETSRLANFVQCARSKLPLAISGVIVVSLKGH